MIYLNVYMLLGLAWLLYLIWGTNFVERVADRILSALHTEENQSYKAYLWLIVAMIFTMLAWPVSVFYAFSRKPH